MKAAAIGLLAVLLAGCDSQSAYDRLQMDINEIRRLCGKSREREAAAQCELEYRIKQQEANKLF